MSRNSVFVMKQFTQLDTKEVSERRETKNNLRGNSTSQKTKRFLLYLEKMSLSFA